MEETDGSIFDPQLGRKRGGGLNELNNSKSKIPKCDWWNNPFPFLGPLPTSPVETRTASHLGKLDPVGGWPKEVGEVAPQGASLSGQGSR